MVAINIQKNTSNNWSDKRRKKASSLSFLRRNDLLVCFFFVFVAIRLIQYQSLKRQGRLQSTKIKQREEHTFWKYNMLNRNESHHIYCQEHYLRNQTFGKEIAPVVDPISAKQIVSEWKIPGLNFLSTLDVYDASSSEGTNLEHFLDQESGQCKCQIQTTHVSPPIIAKASNGTTTTGIINRMLEARMPGDNPEPQFNFIRPRLMKEELFDEGAIETVTSWYLSFGQPVFVGLHCDRSQSSSWQTADRRFFTEDFQTLNMKSFSTDSVTCQPPLQKPKAWDRMREIVRKMGTHLQDKIVRVDLYSTTSQEVYFSSLEFTENTCSKPFDPWIASGLLTAKFHNQVPKDYPMEPSQIKAAIEDRGWSYVFIDGLTVVPESAVSFPSPVDLCETVFGNKNSSSTSPAEGTEECLSQFRYASNGKLWHCLQHHRGGHFDYFGVVRSHRLFRPNYFCTFLLVALVLLTCTGVGVKDHEQNRYRNNAIYFFILSIWLSFKFKNEGYFSEYSPWKVVVESFRAFRHVHPVTSPIICLSHFGTYWVLVAAWRSKSVRNLLFWQLCFEFFTNCINEYTHLHYEPMNHVRCLRDGFIRVSVNYTVDLMIRTYIVPPFFVYGYLLPKFIGFWIGVFLGVWDPSGL